MLLPQLCAVCHCPNIDVLSLGSLPSPRVCTGESISGLPGEIPAWCELVYTSHDLFSSPDHAASPRKSDQQDVPVSSFPEECLQCLLTILNYSYGQHGNKRMCCKTELFNSNSLSHNSHSFPLCCCMPFFLIHNICFPDHKSSLIWRQWVDWTYTNKSWLTDRSVSLFHGVGNYHSPYFWLLQFAKEKKLAMNFPPLLIGGELCRAVFLLCHGHFSIQANTTIFKYAGRERKGILKIYDFIFSTDII